jgi:hypothetical protein
LNIRFSEQWIIPRQPLRITTTYFVRFYLCIYRLVIHFDWHIVIKAMPLIWAYHYGTLTRCMWKLLFFHVESVQWSQNDKSHSRWLNERVNRNRFEYFFSIVLLVQCLLTVNVNWVHVLLNGTLCIQR